MISLNDNKNRSSGASNENCQLQIGSSLETEFHGIWTGGETLCHRGLGMILLRRFKMGARPAKGHYSACQR